MKDIFGYEQSVKSSGEIASSEFAVITIGKRQSLLQSVQGQYGQQIDEVLEIGDSNTYFVPGRARGTISASKLVGADGFFSDWTGGQCGKLQPISINISGGKCGYQGRGGLSFDNGILESVSFSLSAQQLQISQSAQIKIASMQAT